MQVAQTDAPRKTKFKKPILIRVKTEFATKITPASVLSAGYSMNLKSFRSSRSQMFFKIGVLKNFAISQESESTWVGNSNTGVFL